MGIYVVVGASLLGALSCMLIVWSLWTRSQARKRARARMQATQYGAQPSGSYPVASYPSASYPVVQAPVTSGHTVVAMPPAAIEEEPRTQFMSSEELFGEAVPEEPTQFLSDEDLYGAAVEAGDEEEEVATTFMTTDELFGGRPARTDATTVLPEPAPPVVAAPRSSTPRHVPSPQPAGQPRYTGFVGDRAEDRDEDEELDENDPETELVHQAELLRLIGHNKRSE